VSDGVGGQLALGVIGNLATDAAKALWRWSRPWIHEAIGKGVPAADEKAEANALQLARALDDRLVKLEESEEAAGGEGFREKMQSCLEDPDVVATIRLAVLSGARTGSGERHRILASLIAERLRSKTDTAKAAAGNLAVTAIQHLGAEHLRVLGLLALIHVARPSFSDDVDEEKFDLGTPEGQNARYAELTRHGERFVAWLTDALELHHVPIGIDDGTLRHLTAASCIVVDPAAKLRLDKALRPADEAPQSFLTSKRYYGAALERFLAFESGVTIAGRIKEVWYRSLQHAIPTPAGMLIGLAVHDAKTGDTQSDRWEWAATDWRPDHERPRLDALVKKDFDDAVWEAVERKASRTASVGGVLPWQIHGRRR
jgi:hypothetical protein